MNLVRHQLGFSKTESRFPDQKHVPSDLLARRQCGAAAGCRAPRSLSLVRRMAGAAARLVRGLCRSQAGPNVLDYDDLLLFWAQTMTDPLLAGDIGAKFDHVLVDEYQDTNRLQSSILRALKPDGKGLTVVGDDAQAIYSFRAATVRNILDFPESFTPPADVITLDRNYRSTQPPRGGQRCHRACLGAFHQESGRNVIGRAAMLVSVRDEGDQARYIVDRVLENREAAPS